MRTPEIIVILFTWGLLYVQCTKNRLTCKNYTAGYKTFQEHQLNSRRFQVFPGVVDTLNANTMWTVDIIIQPVTAEWWGTGVVICLERGADLHTAQLMPLPLTVSCSSKIQIGFTFLVPAHPGFPGKEAVKWLLYGCCCHCKLLIHLENTSKPTGFNFI